MGEIAKKEQTWPDVVHEVMPEFERISRDNNHVVKWREESQFAIQAIQKNAKLAECAPYTVQNAVINVAAVGLTLNPADGYAYLVPEWVKATNQNECQLRISFKGLIKAATDTGAISWVKAEIVRESDVFQYKGINSLPTHEMNPFADRGEMVGVYCVAKTTTGEYLVDVMTMDQIQQIKSCAKTQKVWDAWFEEMAKKAIIKRASKQWPKTQQSHTFHKAIEVINDYEGSDFEDDFDKLEQVAAEIQDLLEKGDELGAGQIWAETTEKEKEYLWRAKTKGGFFTQQEKQQIRGASALWHEKNTDENQEA